MEQYEEVETEYDDEELTTSDILLIGTGIIAACIIVAFLFSQIRKTFKNVHLKVGDKIEIGVETKEK